MPFTTTEELEAMRIADEEIEREFEESYSAQYADAGISKWLDELAVNDTLDHKQLHKKRQQRAYREEHKDEIAAQQRAYREEHKDEIRAYRRAYQREYRKRKRQQKYMIAAEIKNTAPDTAIVGSGT